MFSVEESAFLAQSGAMIGLVLGRGSGISGDMYSEEMGPPNDTNPFSEI